MTPLSFSTPAAARNLLESPAFDLVLSSTPLKQADPLVRRLSGARCRILYRFPVEDGCWWVPLEGETAKSVGRPASRRAEFRAFLEQVLKEIRDGADQARL